MALTFSIIIPTYNRRSIVGDAIRSIIRQPEAGRGLVEVVMVDDSTDDTLEVAARSVETEPACRLVTHKDPKRLGVTGARNKGIELATGDVLVFLDSDDELTRGALGFMTEFLESHPDVALLFGRIVNKSGKPAPHRKTFLDRLVTYEEFIQDDRIGEFLPVVRRQTLVESGLRFAAEVEGSEGVLWARIPRAGYKMWYSSRILRLYDDVGADRNSTVALRVRRARLFAKGHILELQEFGQDLLRLNRRAYTKKVLKTTIYNRFAEPADAAADAYLRSAHPYAYGVSSLVPSGWLRRGFELWVRIRLA
jgi:glycosyltransferase involved in cell wall biosynthesis